MITKLTKSGKLKETLVNFMVGKGGTLLGKKNIVHFFFQIYLGFFFAQEV